MILFKFFKTIFQKKILLWSLIKNDFKQDYLGSILGIAWAFIQPVFTILIFWFVFQVGFKSKPIGDYPFILWLIAGMIPWFFFAESLSKATNSITSNSYLVKKIVFDISLLPIIKISSALIIHIFFILFMITMFLLYGYPIDLYYLQIFYYLFATVFLVYSISLITSSLSVFTKDVSQLVSMFIQFGFWLTPIFWNMQIVPEKYHIVIQLNPIVYLIEGYRDIFINKIWFWEHMSMTLYFWGFTLILFLLGRVTFKKLKPFFADVL